MSSWREGAFGKRAVRIANCSGYCGDPAIEMYKQATLGDVDFITGDYLAEVNIAQNAEAFASGSHPGYEMSALEGLEKTLDVINDKRIKVAINGGALNPKGLAEKIAMMVQEKRYSLSVAYITGDDLRHQVGQNMPPTLDSALLPHLDESSANSNQEQSRSYIQDAQDLATGAQIVSANAYLGARGILTAFQHGADIVIAGRVSDASPVIAAAWYWWSWSAADYDRLAGALIAGHLIECSAYVTGGNFAGFTEPQYGGLDRFVDPGFPIAEVHDDGSCVITKHPGTGGVINKDTVKCQLLYELQGNVYMHSDTKAVLDGVDIKSIGENRVLVTGIRGLPPPPTTKLAIFYKGGYECQLLFNATGYGWEEKCALLEQQVRRNLGVKVKDLDLLQFQRIGTPATNPTSQNSSTMYIRVVAQGKDAKGVLEVANAFKDISLKHFSGFHCALDMRTAVPRPYIAYYPALCQQAHLKETAHLIGIDESGQTISKSSYPAGSAPAFSSEASTPRDSYDTSNPVAFTGAHKSIRLGDIALARSGDKGPNLNVGVFVRTEKQWEWLRSWLSRERMWQLLGEDADPSYTVERVEFPRIHAVHFVIYGILERGVSSSTRLDAFGKGFADYLRDKIVDVPLAVLQ
ncbi:uncharacterized protein G6M90_00g111520 [Metarhizium brunneum]|uniref:DUF1446 domain-containing protein n=1 Tax=Metarhizium brunneum TaxID=500148 RepID=A0A7D5Z8H5_9HYPO|nr:hypothetical protein G6M90_00g111520 [Metarhizium brunneum]